MGERSAGGPARWPRGTTSQESATSTWSPSSRAHWTTSRDRPGRVAPRSGQPSSSRREQTLEASTSMKVACPNRGLAPTWTHGRLVHCTLSGVTRAELVHHGSRSLRATTDITAATHVGATGARRRSRRAMRVLGPDLTPAADVAEPGDRRPGTQPAWPAQQDRGHRTGACAGWLLDLLRGRTRREHVVPPRLRKGWIAWRDCRRTVRAACRAPRGLLARSRPRKCIAAATELASRCTGLTRSAAGGHRQGVAVGVGPRVRAVG